MNSIKHTPAFKYIFFAAVALVAALSSCKKDDNVTSNKGTSYVIITNALEGSASQDFYLDNAKLSTSAVAYGQSSNYLTITSGDHSGMFTNSGSTSANTNVSLSLTDGQYYSVYYTGGATTSSSYAIYTDDVTAVAGKAKVRFIQLSSALTTGVDFGISATNKLVTNLAYKAASAYNTVDAGTTFSMYASGSLTASLNMPVTLQAGKIYTIYITGATATTIKYNVAVQN